MGGPRLVRGRDGTARAPKDVLDPAERPALGAACAALEGAKRRQENPPD